ncbi:leucine-rich repeat extensin-like protein 3 [Homarus americanus]|uniref:leucine-rich repeat extensin-like protein 3 n=1 Tax=Homarus americanus TaxID=6706 RepID=UPI001C46DEC5|nr:leucine-rich repeat extensin-like protein 3 [Homarus americanus]
MSPAAIIHEQQQQQQQQEVVLKDGCRYDGSSSPPTSTRRPLSFKRTTKHSRACKCFGFLQASDDESWSTVNHSPVQGRRHVHRPPSPSSRRRMKQNVPGTPNEVPRDDIYSSPVRPMMLPVRPMILLVRPMMLAVRPMMLPVRSMILPCLLPVPSPVPPYPCFLPVPSTQCLPNLCLLSHLHPCLPPVPPARTFTRASHRALLSAPSPVPPVCHLLPCLPPVLPARTFQPCLHLLLSTFTRAHTASCLHSTPCLPPVLPAAPSTVPPTRASRLHLLIRLHPCLLPHLQLPTNRAPPALPVPPTRASRLHLHQAPTRASAHLHRASHPCLLSYLLPVPTTRASCLHLPPQAPTPCLLPYLHPCLLFALPNLCLPPVPPARAPSTRAHTRASCPYLPTRASHPCFLPVPFTCLLPTVPPVRPLISCLPPVPPPTRASCCTFTLPTTVLPACTFYLSLLPRASRLHLPTRAYHLCLLPVPSPVPPTRASCTFYSVPPTRAHTPVPPVRTFHTVPPTRASCSPSTRASHPCLLPCTFYRVLSALVCRHCACKGESGENAWVGCLGCFSHPEIVSAQRLFLSPKTPCPGDQPPAQRLSRRVLIVRLPVRGDCSPGDCFSK